jgi:hypothetical protein
VNSVFGWREGFSKIYFLVAAHELHIIKNEKVCNLRNTAKNYTIENPYFQRMCG